MAQNSELKTFITADNKQFLTTMGNSAMAAKNFGTQATASFSMAGSMLKGGLIGTVVIQGLKTLFGELDNVADSAARIGVSAESFQFLEYAAARSGIEMSSLERVMTRMRLSLSKAETSTSLQDSLQKLGLSAKQLRDLAPEEQLFTLLDAIKQLPKGEQIDIGTEFLGRKFQDAVLLANKNVSELKTNFEQLGGAADTSFAETFGDAIDDMSVQLKAARGQLFNTFGPTALAIMKSAAAGIAELVRGITQGFEAAIRLAERLNNLGFTDEQNASGAAVRAQYNALPSAVQAQQGAVDKAMRAGDKLPEVNFARIASGLNQFGDMLNNIIRAVSPDMFMSQAASGIAGEAAKQSAMFIDSLGVASNAAAGALNKLAEVDLKNILGLSDMDGKDYLRQILKPITQVENANFTDLANEIRDDIASGGDVNGARIQSGIATLRRWAADQSVGTGESKSGMVNAAKVLTEMTAKMKPPKQEVVVELIYDQDGIIKAFVSSSKMASATGDIVRDITAKEAQSTIASGG